jgi:hypothetical protein
MEHEDTTQIGGDAVSSLRMVPASVSETGPELRSRPATGSG